MMKRVTSTLAVALAAIAFSATTANAQGAAAGGADQQEAQQLMQEYRQKASRLQQIHENTIEANPELAAQQEEFEKKVRQAVEDEGYNVEQGQERVQELAQKMQSGDLEQSERQAVMQDFQAERQEMTQARNEVMQQPEIQSAGQELQEDTLAAMKEQNSETQTLLDDMDSLRSELQSKMPQSGQAPAPGQSPGSG